MKTYPIHELFENYGYVIFWPSGPQANYFSKTPNDCFFWSGGTTTNFKHALVVVDVKQFIPIICENKKEYQCWHSERDITVEIKKMTRFNNDPCYKIAKVTFDGKIIKLYDVFELLDFSDFMGLL